MGEPLVVREQGGSILTVKAGGAINNAGTILNTGTITNNGAQTVGAAGTLDFVNGAEQQNDGVQASNITDASVAHALADVFDDEEAEAGLDALGVKINAILLALEGVGILAPS